MLLARSMMSTLTIAAFFIEEPGADGTLAGRFLKMRAPGGPCSCDCVLEEAFLRDCR